MQAVGQGCNLLANMALKLDDGSHFTQYRDTFGRVEHTPHGSTSGRINAANGKTLAGHGSFVATNETLLIALTSLFQQSGTVVYEKGEKTETTSQQLLELSRTFHFSNAQLCLQCLAFRKCSLPLSPRLSKTSACYQQ